MSSTEVDATFGPPVDLPDDGGSMIDYPIVEPLSFDTKKSAGTESGRSWLAIGVAILLFVQLGSLALQFRDRAARDLSPSTTATIPQQQAHPTPFLERSLRSAHEQFTRGLYADVVSALEPMLGTAKLVGPARSLEVHLLLARAYAELGQLEKAAEHRRFASLTAVGREDALDLLAGGHRLDREGRHADARRRFHEVLCLVDPDSETGAGAATLARQALGDSLRTEAFARDDLAELPGELETSRGRTR